jgi:hypothetical protein
MPMHDDAASLIEDVISRLEALRGLLAEDATVCRRAGMGVDARHCSDALDGIALLLPRLERARLSQDAPYPHYGRVCIECEE